MNKTKPKNYPEVKARAISLVDTPMPISNNNDSYVQILTSFIKARATKSSSFSCLPNNCFALGKDEANVSFLTQLILLKINATNSEKSDSESFDFLRISDLF